MCCAWKPIMLLISGAGSTISTVLADEVLRDTLCIGDLALYEEMYPSFCNGEYLFNVAYNIQSADSFGRAEGYWITAFSVDFLTAYGTEPDHVCVAFYRALPRFCDVSEQTSFEFVLARGSFSWSEFDDAVFQMQGRRLAVSVSRPVRLEAVPWYLSVQPSSFSDYYFIPAARYGADNCFAAGNAIFRDGREDNSCCDGRGEYDSTDWVCDGSFEPDTLSMRVEGIPAGDCVGGERVWARCRARSGEQVGDVVVKVRSGQPNGTVTALLDPPDPQSMSIPLDGSGRGKGKFKGVSLGDHRVFVCDAIVDVTCAP